ncbi:MAG: alpha/beta fold hydrolase [Proteobacteria bacterium]|nr:alpha/beta fold hydrolase [Pseudomonadota bacterium]
MLHGWGINHTVWKTFSSRLTGFDKIISPCLYDVADQINDSSLMSLANETGSNIKNDCVVIGWSLGGLIALYLATMFKKVKGVIFITSTPKFVNNDNWLFTIDISDHRELYRNLTENHDQTVRYFSQLVAHGDTSAKQTIKYLSSHLTKSKYNNTLRFWLNELEQLDLRQQFCKLSIPALILLANNDALIKWGISDQLRILNPDLGIKNLPDCGHAPFISKERETTKLIKDFIDAEFDR